MTLDELLALLPDNTTGAISAADVRVAVTELYNANAGNTTAIANLANQVTALGLDVAALAGLDADVQTLQGQVAALQGEVAASSATLVSHGTLLSTHGDQIGTLQANVGALQTNVATLQDEVTALQAHNSYAQVFSYLWTNTAGPAVGKVTVDAWSMAATKIQINETTDDGQALTFQLLDNATHREIRLLTADGKRMRATMNGVSVDNGAYRDLLVTVTEVVGAAPTLNQRTSVAIILEMAA